ncbi:MAG: endonuclease [Vicingaceae bacterium]|nr:endonuclease [Vicingaceae bacterium]
MKKIFGLFLFLLSVNLIAQIPSYYNGVNLTLTGMALKSELSQKIINTHTNQLTYTNVWSVLQQTDLDPTNSSNVLLLYGYNDGDSNPITDRTRSKNNNGGSTGQWNREHTYAQSLATPSMNTSSPNAGTDAHHLRSTDVQMNGNRGNRLFASGSGNAGNVGSNWYPGDEWKGDVARMMMYMYLRYPSQCKPNNVGIGSSVAIDPSMITLFLQWNVDDTVSVYETNRNVILEGQQGNRNPFIDNPYLATLIWGGQSAQDKWNMTNVPQYYTSNQILVYPVPSNTGSVNIQYGDRDMVSLISVYSIDGRQISTVKNPKLKKNIYALEELPKGLYLINMIVNQETITKKIVIH